MKAQPRIDYLTVGVTGGIGSGKTTVCRLFATLGRHVISADELARTIADTDPAVRRQIQDAFGPELYKGTTLDRPAMAARVFSRPRELRKLNAIVHPAVFAAIDRQINRLPPAARFPYLLVEAALVFETGFNSRLDYVIAVEAGEALRVDRIMARDGLSGEEIRRRMGSQMSTAEKKKKADVVLINEGSETDLMPGIRILDGLLTALAGAKA
jgi:dephospho-CoA kinase